MKRHSGQAQSEDTVLRGLCLDVFVVFGVPLGRQASPQRAALGVTCGAEKAHACHVCPCTSRRMLLATRCSLNKALVPYTSAICICQPALCWKHLGFATCILSCSLAHLSHGPIPKEGMAVRPADSGGMNLKGTSLAKAG